MLTVSNIRIMWGDINITHWFNLESVDEVASSSPFTYKQEITASGKACLTAAVNTDNNFTITVTRNDMIDPLIKNDFAKLRGLFKEVKIARLRVTKSDGTVLIEYKNALLVDDKFLLGEVSDGQKSTVKITWSVSNA